MRLTRFIKNNKAQIHMLEVVIVTGLLLISLYFVKGFTFAPYTQVSQQNKIENLGDSILRSLDAVPDPKGDYSSLLARYLIEAKDDDNFYYLTDFINSSIPDGTLYKIEYVDVSGYYKNSMNQDLTINDYTDTIYSKVAELGTMTSSNRLVVIDGNIYRIILKIYINIG